MGRRSYSREFKLEAVRLVSERGLTMAQAARDLDLHENVLRKWWVRQYREDPAHAFPGAGQLKSEQAEMVQLKKEIRKLKAERDILKKAAFFSRAFSRLRRINSSSRALPWPGKAFSPCSSSNLRQRPSMCPLIPRSFATP